MHPAESRQGEKIIDCKSSPEIRRMDPPRAVARNTSRVKRLAPLQAARDGLDGSIPGQAGWNRGV